MSEERIFTGLFYTQMWAKNLVLGTSVAVSTGAIAVVAAFFHVWWLAILETVLASANAWLAKGAYAHLIEHSVPESLLVTDDHITWFKPDGRTMVFYDKGETYDTSTWRKT